MIEHVEANSDQDIVSKAVKDLPNLFSVIIKAQMKKYSRWCNVCETTIALKSPRRRVGIFTVSCALRNKRFQMKELSVRGINRTEWVAALYDALHQYFERIRSAVVKFSRSVLRKH